MSSHDPQLRIGDAEREGAVTALGEHYAAGRLSKDEFDERADLAWSARTSADLWPLFTDLPRPEASSPPPVPGGDRRGRRSTRDRRDPAHPGWLFGIGVLPVLLVFFGLVVLTHFPLFLALLVVWLLVLRTGRHRRHRLPHGGHSGGPRGWAR